ncbi:DUF2635 domain-containing protein [Pararoseomonas sp. SCSIO 73927]|uniref:DUF2635 domain-containing protein n=1 Tax=Pararoseomonas sp. SCSIO 73927 TaxID=3114537 RepID=UPI0030CDF9AD
MIYVIPREGTLVPDPVLHDFLPPEGRWVERTEHWVRILRDQDAREGEPPEAEASVTPAPEPVPDTPDEPAPEAVFTPPPADEEHPA